MKYKIPKIDKLEELDFQFEFDTIKEVLKYTKKFVKQNKQDLIELFFPELDADEYEKRQDDEKNNPNTYVTEIVKTKIRIASGNIQKQDYMWVVPPWLKNDKSILLKVYQNRLEKYMIDTNLAFYNQTYLGISRKKAFKLVLQNNLLRLIIENLPKHGIGAVKQDKRIEELFSIDEQIGYLSRKSGDYYLKGQKLLSRSFQQQILKLEYEKYELLFSKRLSIRQRAERTYRSITGNLNSSMNPKYFSKSPEYTSIQEKEDLIRQYLKLQTLRVRASRNTRGNGINAKKKQTVLDYYSKNPDATISEISRQCKVDRKTVRKYLGK